LRPRRPGDASRLRGQLSAVRHRRPGYRAALWPGPPAFAQTDVRLYPRELMRVRALQVEAKLLQNDLEGARSMLCARRASGAGATTGCSTSGQQGSRAADDPHGRERGLASLSGEFSALYSPSGRPGPLVLAPHPSPSQQDEGTGAIDCEALAGGSCCRSWRRGDELSPPPTAFISRPPSP
jgi:hypothetical protein